MLQTFQQCLALALGHALAISNTHTCLHSHHVAPPSAEYLIQPFMRCSVENGCEKNRTPPADTVEPWHLVATRYGVCTKRVQVKPWSSDRDSSRISLVSSRAFRTSDPFGSKAPVPPRSCTPPS